MLHCTGLLSIGGTCTVYVLVVLAELAFSRKGRTKEGRKAGDHLARRHHYRQHHHRRLRHPIIQREERKEAKSTAEGGRQRGRDRGREGTHFIPPMQCPFQPPRPSFTVVQPTFSTFCAT